MESLRIICLLLLLCLLLACGKSADSDLTQAVRNKSIEIQQTPEVVSVRHPADITTPQIQFNSLGDAILAWIPDDHSRQSKLSYRIFDHKSELWGSDQFVLLPWQNTYFQLSSNNLGFAIATNDGLNIGLYALKFDTWTFLGPFASYDTGTSSSTATEPAAMPVQGKLIWPASGNPRALKNLNVVHTLIAGNANRFYFLSQTYRGKVEKNEWHGNVFLELNIVVQNTDGEFGVIDKIEITQHSDFVEASLTVNAESVMISWQMSDAAASNLIVSRQYRFQDNSLSDLATLVIDDVDAIVSFQQASNTKFNSLLWVAEAGGKTIYGLHACERNAGQECQWQLVERTAPQPGSSTQIGYYELHALADSFVLLNTQLNTPLKFYVYDADWDVQSISLPEGINLTARAIVNQKKLWISAYCNASQVPPVSDILLAGEQCQGTQLLTYKAEDNALALQQQDVVDESQVGLASLAVNPLTEFPLLVSLQASQTDATKIRIRNYDTVETEGTILTQDSVDINSSENPRFIALDDSRFLLTWQETHSDGLHFYIRPFENNEWLPAFSIDSFFKDIHSVKQAGRVVFAWSDFTGIKTLIYDENGFSDIRSVEAAVNPVLDLDLLVDDKNISMIYYGRKALDHQLFYTEYSAEQWSEPKLVVNSLVSILKVWLKQNSQQRMLFWRENKSGVDNVYAKTLKENAWSESRNLFSATLTKDICVEAAGDYFLIQWNDYQTEEINANAGKLVSYAKLLNADSSDEIEAVLLGDGSFNLQCRYYYEDENTLALLMAHKSHVKRHRFALTEKKWDAAETLYEFDANDAIFSASIYTESASIYVLWQSINVNNSDGNLYLVDLSNDQQTVRYHLAHDDINQITKMKPDLLFSADKSVNVAWLGNDSADLRNSNVPQVLFLRNLLPISP